jgi:hypothetical protein
MPPFVKFYVVFSKFSNLLKCFLVMPGEVLSMQFASLGAKLILSARNKDELERVKQNIVSKFEKHMFSSKASSSRVVKI